MTTISFYIDSQGTTHMIAEKENSMVVVELPFDILDEFQTAEELDEFTNTVISALDTVVK